MVFSIFNPFSSDKTHLEKSVKLLAQKADVFIADFRDLKETECMELSTKNCSLSVEKIAQGQHILSCDFECYSKNLQILDDGYESVLRTAYGQSTFKYSSTTYFSNLLCHPSNQTTSVIAIVGESMMLFSSSVARSSEKSWVRAVIVAVPVSDIGLQKIMKLLINSTGEAELIRWKVWGSHDRECINNISFLKLAMQQLPVGGESLMSAAKKIGMRCHTEEQPNKLLFYKGVDHTRRELAKNPNYWMHGQLGRGKYQRDDERRRDEESHYYDSD
jgi:hypothetical protein